MAATSASSSPLPSPRRVLLWALPRTMSTAFLKCMSFVDGIQVIHEPFGSAKYYGPERIPLQVAGFKDIIKETVAEIADKDIELNAPLAYDETTVTYDWVKKTLEADYPGKKLVFCKAMTNDLECKYEAIPIGFKHTFLIRDPLKVFVSTRKLTFRYLALPIENEVHFRLTDMPRELYNPPKHMFGEMVDLLHYLRDNQMESNPVVIDADDLLSNPQSILRQYFEAIGVPFSKDLLQWESGNSITSTWIAAKNVLKANKLDRGGYYDRAFASSTFVAPKNLAPDESELTPDVVELAKAADKYYKELYEMRLKP